MMPMMDELRKSARALPQFFYGNENEAWKESLQNDVVLRTWEVESAHDYENNLNIKQVCLPVIQFDVKQI